MPSKQLSNKEIEAQAAEIVRREKTQWETATAFVTNKVAFNMRYLIRELRKNYWGVFDQQIDPITQKKKIWVPMTEAIVESVVKNIDLDQKDINFRAKNPSAIGLTRVVRSIVKNYLDEMFFGEKLDQLERDLAIDGTKVWKTLEKMDRETRKTTLQIVEPDLLNLYIDPTAASIKDAYRFTERALMTADEVKNMKGWINTEEVIAVTGLPRVDPLAGVTKVSSGTNKYIDVWELWGQIPERLITGNPEHNEDIEGRIVVSGLEGGTVYVHLIERNKGIRPYEEAWYTKVANRWYGKGIAEKVMWLQLWLNTIVNLRVNRGYIAQLGIFKIKKGAGITPQILRGLVSNGAITVNNQDDIEQLVIQEPGDGSYKDAADAYDWGQKVTGAFDVAVGDENPASTSATANAIQNTNAQSQFTLIKEGIGMFLQRWMKRHALPIIMKRVTLNELIRCTGDADEIRALDELIVNNMIADEIKTMNDLARQGVPAFVHPDQMAALREDALRKLQLTGEDRYVKLLHNLDPSEYDTEVYITNEEIDKGVLSQNLISILQLAPEYRDDIMQDLFDVMGLPFFPKKQAPQGPSAPVAQTQPTLGQLPGPTTTQNPQQVVQRANQVNV